jgi:hypothetical protein
MTTPPISRTSPASGLTPTDDAVPLSSSAGFGLLPELLSPCVIFPSGPMFVCLSLF